MISWWICVLPVYCGKNRIYPSMNAEQNVNNGMGNGTERKWECFLWNWVNWDETLDLSQTFWWKTQEKLCHIFFLVAVAVIRNHIWKVFHCQWKLLMFSLHKRHQNSLHTQTGQHFYIWLGKIAMKLQIHLHSYLLF